LSLGSIAYWGLAVGGSDGRRYRLLGPLDRLSLCRRAVIGGNALSLFLQFHFLRQSLLAAPMFGHPPLAGDQEGISAPVKPANLSSENLRFGYDGSCAARFRSWRSVLRISFSRRFDRCVVGSPGDRAQGPPVRPIPSLGGANPRPECRSCGSSAPLSMAESPAGRHLSSSVFSAPIILALRRALMSNGGERVGAPIRRPLDMLGRRRRVHGCSNLTYRVDSPCRRQMHAWSGNRPRNIVRQCNPRKTAGALVFNTYCRHLSALQGLVGRRGPDLTFVGFLLTAIPAIAKS